MRTDMNRARAFGRRVAEAQDDALRGQDSLREARALWLAPSLAPTPAAKRAARALDRASGGGWNDWRPWAGTVLAATLAAAGVLLWIDTPPAALAFQVGPSEAAIAGAKAQPGVVGELVAAPVAERLPVRFSDGSLVRLEPGARARFVEVRDNGSRVLLESGVAHANVVHRGETRWTVQAGSFEVRVTGTQFDVAWDPPRGLFSITLQEGRVVVSGCAMDQARVVSAGETFRATCKDDERGRSLSRSAPTVLAEPSSSSSLAPVAVPAPVQSTVASQAPSPIRAPLAPAPGAPSPAPVAAPVPTWRELLALHRYAEAFDVADAVGIASICASTDAATLMDLSDAARFAGHADRARFVLEEVRRRFAGDDRASVAAFNLGRIAFDDSAAYPEAARWFATYLAERAQGPLAREAAGRHMEALERSGDHPAARDAAARYLQEFPSGPHADVARSIAER